MIELKNVTKRYGAIHAVNDVSFHIGKGEIVGFLGQNGAGKSTTMNMITGYISRTAGEITVGGVDVLEKPMQARQMIGYLPEQPPLYMDMTVTEYLKFVCELKNVPRKQIKAQLDEAIDTVQLSNVAGRLIANLSKGYKQRVGLAQTLCGSPKLIILDEPTVGLDPTQIVEIRETIKKLGENHTIILSSHILHDVADVCKRAIIIDKGRLIADDDISVLTGETGENDIRIQTSDDENAVRGAFAALQGCSVTLCRKLSGGKAEYLVSMPEDVDAPRDVPGVLVQSGLPLYKLGPASSSLEETFLALTQKNTEA